MYCPYCDSDVETSIRLIPETYPVKGEDITIQAQVRVCSCCGNAIWDEELDSKNLLNAFAQYRKKNNLLQPEDIRETREKYGLSQTAFARILGFGDKTITRYENGSIPDAAQNNLMELVQQPSNFKYLLEKNKERISTQDYNAACDKLTKLSFQVMYNNQQTATLIFATNSNIELSTTVHWGDKLYA